MATADLSNLSTYELQLKVEELRKRLGALDEFGNDKKHAQSEDGRNREAEKEAIKTAILHVMQSAVNVETSLNREATVVVNFPNIKGGFSFELSGSSLTWSDIKDRACVMFGHNPDETLIVGLRDGQRVLVPTWMALVPGQHIDADIVDKPPVFVKAKSLRSRDSSFRKLIKHTSSGGSSGHATSSKETLHMPMDTMAFLDPERVQRSRLASRKEVVCDFFLHLTIFILLSIGLLDPINVSGPLRWFERALAWFGQVPFLSTRSGGDILLSFDTNVTSTSEAWDWIDGPLTEFLVQNESSSGFPKSNAFDPQWFGDTSSEVCPVALNDEPPLCSDFNFSTAPAGRPRWITKSLSTEVIGSVRLRQFRVRPNSCRNALSDGQVVFADCYADYSLNTRETTSYGPGVCGFEWRSERELAGVRPGAPTVQGVITNYDSSGFVLDVASANEWVPALTYLRTNGWVTAATKAVIIEFTVTNPNEELFSSVRALIEIDMTGSARTSYNISPMRIPMSGTGTEVRFITDLICLILILVLLLKVLLGGFFHKPKQRIWRTYDFIFSLLYIASFGVDMGMYVNFNNWKRNFSTASTMYWSLDYPHYYVETANRFRAVLIVMITLRFLLQGTFSLSRVTNVVLSRLFCIYMLLLILLIPFMASLALLVMVLEQGSPNHDVTFGNALRDIFLIVTGVTDRLTAATPRVGRQTGWSVVFYLFLITFTWVLVVPTLIAFAVITYERAADVKHKLLGNQQKDLAGNSSQEGQFRGLGKSSLQSSHEASLEQDLSSAFPVPESPGMGTNKEIINEQLDYDPDNEKSAAQTLMEDLATTVDRLGNKTWRKLRTVTTRSTAGQEEEKATEG